MEWLRRNYKHRRKYDHNPFISVLRKNLAKTIESNWARRKKNPIAVWFLKSSNWMTQRTIKKFMKIFRNFGMVVGAVVDQNPIFLV